MAIYDPKKLEENKIITKNRREIKNLFGYWRWYNSPNWKSDTNRLYDNYFICEKGFFDDRKYNTFIINLNPTKANYCKFKFGIVGGTYCELCFKSKYGVRELSISNGILYSLDEKVRKN